LNPSRVIPDLKQFKLPKKGGRWQAPANLTKVAQYPGYKSKVTFALLHFNAIVQKSLWGISRGESFPALEQLFKLRLGLFGGTGVKSERGTVDLHP
jgi:hypothetical protein